MLLQFKVFYAYVVYNAFSESVMGTFKCKFSYERGDIYI